VSLCFSCAAHRSAFESCHIHYLCPNRRGASRSSSKVVPAILAQTTGAILIIPQSTRQREFDYRIRSEAQYCAVVGVERLRRRAARLRVPCGACDNSHGLFFAKCSGTAVWRKVTFALTNPGNDTVKHNVPFRRFY
jgi:hypothetical protein